MSDTPKTKDQEKADQRRDELAKRVLKTPPIPRKVGAKAKTDAKQQKSKTANS